MDCPICYEPATSNTNNCTLSCSHTFHLKCMTTWMQSAQTCPMCRMDFAEPEPPQPDPSTDPRYKRMKNIYIREDQIERIRREARVSRGLAIRSAQRIYPHLECVYIEDDDDDVECAIRFAKFDRNWLMRGALENETWDVLSPEQEAFMRMREMFGDPEEMRSPDLTAKHLRKRHRFSGFYDWHCCDWEEADVVDRGYVTN